MPEAPAARSTMRSPKPENLPRWDGRRGWYEVWYATTNHAPSGTALWLRYTLHVPADAEGHATIWGVAFDRDGPVFAARQDHPLTAVRLGGETIMRVGDALLAEGHLAGALTDDGGRVLTWDLSFDPAEDAVGPLPHALERVTPSYYLNPNLDVRASGTVNVGDRILELDTEPMGQSHVWGRHHAGAWAWMHLHVDDGFVIEAIQARPHAAARIGRRLPSLPFAVVSLLGSPQTFGPAGPWRARGRYTFPVWHLSLRGPDIRLEVSVRAPERRFIQVTYHDPDGSPAYCANSEVADGVVEVYRRYGRAWRQTEIHELSGRSHLEFGARSPYPGVPVVF